LAVVFGEGPIVARESKDGLFGAGNWMLGPVVAKSIREAAENEDVKAILFRVDSPGGSAVGSDVVLREIDRAREKGKPVVVSMSSIAGSGGYWIAMHADGIVAQPTTITGSIGVVFAKFNLTGFMDWIGANVDTVSTAPLADIFGTAPLDPDRRARVEAWMEDLYESFKAKVAEGRDIPPEKVEEIARGRIWTGQDALELGLVDRLGGLDEAIDLAKELADLDPDVEYPLVVFPKPKPFLQQILEEGLFAGTPSIPTEAEILEFARETAQPRVLARMPDIRIY
jgi:protease-4